MVDVSEKRETAREDGTRGPQDGARDPAGDPSWQPPKGDVLGVARTAGILAAKRTPQLIRSATRSPHRVDVPFPTTSAAVSCEVLARVSTWTRRGVEMEALTG